MEVCAPKLVDRQPPVWVWSRSLSEGEVGSNGVMVRISDESATDVGVMNRQTCSDAFSKLSVQDMILVARDLGFARGLRLHL